MRTPGLRTSLFSLCLLALAAVPGFGQSSSSNPQITSVSPTSLPASQNSTGASITITGTGFCGLTQTFFVVGGNGNQLSTVISGSTINATIPGNLLTTSDPNSFVYVSNGIQCSPGGVSNSFPLPVANAPVLKISNSPLPNGTVNQPYSVQLAFSGGTSPYGFSANFATLPPGLSVSSGGLVSGTPTQTGTFTTTGTIFDSADNSSTGSFQITIVNPPTTPPVLSSLSPNSAQAGSIGFLLTITGTPICTGAQLVFGTTQIPLAIANSGQATASIPASSLVTPGTVQVYFTNPASSPSNSSTFCSNPGQSNSLPFTITSAATLTSITPTQATAGSTGITLTAAANRFCSGAVLQFGSSQIPLSFVSSGQATANIPATLLATPGTVSVSFTNPTSIAGASNNLCPAPGQSNALPFVIAPQPTLSPATLPSGVVSVPYQQAITASGGTPPYTLTTLGQLPPGLSLSSGTITGTPTTPGTFPFAIQLSDAGGFTGAFQYQIVINSGFQVTSVSPSPIVSTGQAVPVTITGTGFCSNSVVRLDTSVLSSSIPAGNNGTQLIATIPANLLQTSRNANVTVDNSQCPSTGSTSLPVAIITPLQVAPASLSNGVINQLYGPQIITISGGTAPYTVALSGLPAGLSFTPTSTGGTISGTPTVAGTFTITGTAQDSGTSAQSRSFSYNLTITVPPPRFITTALSDASQNLAYQATLLAAGGVPPYTFSLPNPSAFPPGLTLTPDGQIIGKPTTPGLYTFPVQLVDSQGSQPANFVVQTFTLRVVSTTPGLSITTTSLPNGRVGQQYAFPLAASGGDGNYTWTLISGGGNDIQLSSTGALFGTPTQAGTRQIVVQVTDGKGASTSASLSLTITGSTLSIPPTPDVTLTTGATYTQPIVVNGGTGPFTISVLSGMLPSGVTQNGSTFSGTVTTPGTFTYTVRAQDASGNAATQTYNVIVVSPVTILTTVLATPSPNTAYAQAIQVSGGTPPYSFTLASGSLPTGLSLSSTGTISGTPTGNGSFTFTVQVADAANQIKTQQYTLTLGTGFVITTASPLTGGTVGQTYTPVTIQTAGGNGTVQFQVTSGTLPTGLSLNSSGTLSGTPAAAGSFSFTVQATDASQTTTSKTFTVTVVQPLRITTTTLPSGNIGSPYTAAITATGGTGSGYVFTVTSGTLPAGLQLGPDGTFVGSPTAGGSSTFTVTVTDSSGATATQTYTVQVGLPPVPTVTVTALPATVTPTDQGMLGVSVSSPFPAPITGTATLTFTPNTATGGDDLTVGFAGDNNSVTRTLTFVIPPNQTQAIFSGVPALSFGTTAGTITVTVTANANGQPIALPANVATQTIQIARTAPVITSVTGSHTATGISVVVTGFSTPREVTSARFQFLTSNGTVQSNDITVQVGTAFQSFYSGTGSSATGSQFVLTQPFTVQGSAAITGVTVTLTNSVGTSNSVTNRF